jgi:hypothetical protein
MSESPMSPSSTDVIFTPRSRDSKSSKTNRNSTSIKARWVNPHESTVNTSAYERMALSRNEMKNTNNDYPSAWGSYFASKSSKHEVNIANFFEHWMENKGIFLFIKVFLIMFFYIVGGLFCTLRYNC